MAEYQEVQQDVADQEAGPQVVVATDVDVTPNGLADFDSRAHRFARDHNYFNDAPDGAAYSPHRVYEMTQNLAAGALTMDGNVDVIAPRLETRHKKNLNEPFGAQAIAREFAIQGVRLKAIRAFRDTGILSGGQASGMLGGQTPEDALQDHELTWQKWLTNNRQLQAKQKESQNQSSLPPGGGGDNSGFDRQGLIPSGPSRRLSVGGGLRRGMLRAVFSLTTIASMLLTSCQQAGIGSGEIPTSAPTTPAGEVDPTLGTNPTEIAPNATDVPGIPTPAEFTTTEEAPVSLYRAPYLSEAEFVSGAGGSGRNEIITIAGVPEETLVAYEDAAYAQAKASGFSKDAVELHYEFNGSDAWNMYLVNKATGDVLWTQNADGSYSTFPLSIKVDAVNGVHADPDAKLIAIEGTKNADVRYVGDFLIIVNGEPVTAGEGKYFTKWFNTIYAEFQDIPEVKAALPPVEVAAVDPTTSYTEWPADVQAQFLDVLTTPSTATEAQKQAYDTFIISQWQRTLKDAGVASAESLQGYDLLNAIIEYTKTNNIHEVSSLPFALRLKIVSDKDNIIEYGVGKGLDSNLRPSYYGFGWNSSPRPTVDRLRDDAKLFFSAIHFYGQTVQRPESGSFVTPTFGLEGDLVVRFDLPGVSPEISQGGLIRMIDANGVARYATIVINYQATTTTNQQDCITVSGNQLVGGVCAAGDPLGAVRMNLVSRPTDHVPVTREKLDSVMEQSSNELHIAIYTTTPEGDNVFSDGSAVVASWQVASPVDLNK